MPLELIDKQDNFEIVREEIASILAVETANQQIKAVAAGKDPKLWEFKVYTERSLIWKSLTNTENPVVPVVNISFESSEYASDQAAYTLTQITDSAIYNIDIFTSALTEELVAGGQIPGDRQSIIDCQRITRLIRNILYSVPPDTTVPGDDYAYFNMSGIVMERKLQTIQSYIPNYKEQGIYVTGTRMVLAVKFSEFALEGPDNPLNLLQATTIVNEFGEVIYEFDLS